VILPKHNLAKLKKEKNTDKKNLSHSGYNFFELNSSLLLESRAPAEKFPGRGEEESNRKTKTEK